MAIALENCNLHRRLSLATLRIMGTSTPLVMLAVMLPTWFLSASGICTESSKKNLAKFSDTCSVKADGLCIGC